MQKVLIIVYYWPPSGGAGVQRWVKLSKYLQKQGHQVFVITVNPDAASYTNIDNSLENDINENIKVYKTNSFEPLNIYSKLFKKKLPSAGFANTDNSGFFSKLITFIRSNIFIPDPRRGWNKYAYKQAVELILKENIKTVITSSPPHSSQLIGYKLKKNFDINWISDLRDPWTDIYYYNLLNHTLFSKYIDKCYEKLILKKADTILTVSEGLKTLFLNKNYIENADKIKVITNGFDEEDFNGITKAHENNKFVISYIGTITEQYNPNTFFCALKNVIKKYPEKEIQLQFIGSLSLRVEEELKKLELEKHYTKINYVEHKKALEYMVNSSCLLLFIPDVKNAKGILTGKLMEYIGSRKPIICIGEKDSNAEKIILDCNSGLSFERENIEGIETFIEKLINNYSFDFNDNEIQKYSRRSQALVLADVIF